jgi:hypothetical protein
MAENKGKRPVSLAQPERRRLHPEPAELMPVKVHVYRTIAELNGGFEKVLQDLQSLGSINYFRACGATAAHRMIARIRAQLNREFAITLHKRETANADHFDRLHAESAQQTGI